MIRELMKSIFGKGSNPIWNNLTEEEKKEIHDPRDYPIHALIKKLSPRELREFYNSIKFKEEFRKHYIDEEKVWINKARWYMGEKKNREIKDVEIADEILNKNLHEKYRIYYAAKFRGNVELSENSRLAKFLSAVDADFSR
jgi:hypothetical protein